MKLQPQLLLLASLAAALVMSHGALAGGTHAMPVQTLHGSIVEDDDAAGFGASYPQRRVLANGDMYIGYKGLEANKAACYGSCPGRGQAYTGRGCKNIFGCPGT